MTYYISSGTLKPTHSLTEVRPLTSQIWRVTASIMPITYVPEIGARLHVRRAGNWYRFSGAGFRRRFLVRVSWAINRGVSLSNSGLCWTVFARNNDTAVPAEGNGDLQTLICVLVARPRWCLTLSNLVPWQNWMTAYFGYTLQMKTLFRGWPVMVNDTHTRRRIEESMHGYKSRLSWTVASRVWRRLLSGLDTVSWVIFSIMWHIDRQSLR